MIFVDLADCLVKSVEIFVRSRRCGLSAALVFYARFVHEVVHRNGVVVFVAICYGNPYFHCFETTYFARFVLSPKSASVGIGNVAGVVVSALRTDCAVHIEDGVKRVFFAHFDCPIETGEFALVHFQLFIRRSFVTVADLFHRVYEIQICEGNPHAIQTEGFYALKIDLAHPIAFVYVQKFLHAVFAESVCKLYHHVDLSVLFADIGWDKPAFLNKPTSEICAVKSDGVAFFVDYFRSVGFDKRNGFFIVVARKKRKCGYEQS